VAVVLLIAYVGQLIFSLRTHKHLYLEEDGLTMHGQVWSVRHSLIVLLGSTVVVAFMSELLIEGVEHLTATLGMSELFVGVILVAIIGNAAEHLTAVIVAMKNKMDLAINIAMGSALQIALFVAPVLVIVGILMGPHNGEQMDMVFNLFEVAAVVVTMFVVNAITQDGESNWFEGLQLLAAYAIQGIVFFFHP
jgi:Ca2+:H+ antiporter